MKDWQKKKLEDLIKSESREVAIRALENLKKAGLGPFWEPREIEEAMRFVKEFPGR